MVRASAFWWRVVFWVGLYALFVLAPLGVALIGFDGRVRSFWAEFGIGLGLVGLSMMALQFVLTARFKGIAAPFGTDAMLQFHRQAGLVACAFVFGHVVILIAARPANLAFFDPRVNLPRAVALTTVLIALAGLVGLTLMRKRLRIPYEWWRLTHGLLALLVMLISLAHVLMVGRYVSGPAKQLIWIALTAAAMGLLLYPRIVKPWLARRRPYTVTAVRSEAPRVWTLTIEPEGHEGMRFEPGQFAWLTPGGSPFSLQQHPFTFAGSAETPGRLLFTIKELGDFTANIGKTEPGARAWLEGPCGAFTPSVDASRLVMIAGGIGVTPMLSILRTMRDRGDKRPVALVFGADEGSGLVARDELEELARGVSLELILVLENPGDGWRGETGLIDGELLKRTLPPDEPGAEYFICGPAPMMNAAEKALMRKGVPLHRRRSERFDIA